MPGYKKTKKTKKGKKKVNKPSVNQAVNTLPSVNHLDTRLNAAFPPLDPWDIFAKMKDLENPELLSIINTLIDLAAGKDRIVKSIINQMQEGPIKDKLTEIMKYDNINEYAEVWGKGSLDSENWVIEEKAYQNMQEKTAPEPEKEAAPPLSPAPAPEETEQEMAARWRGEGASRVRASAGARDINQLRDLHGVSKPLLDASLSGGIYSVHDDLNDLGSLREQAVDAPPTSAYYDELVDVDGGSRRYRKIKRKSRKSRRSRKIKRKSIKSRKRKSRRSRNKCLF